MDVLVPKENNNDQLVMISKLYCNSGDYISKGDDLIEFETSKTAVVLESPATGYVTFLHNVDDEVEVNSVVCTINESVSSENKGVSMVSDEEPKNTAASNVRFSKKARELDGSNIDLDGKYWITSNMLLKPTSLASPVSSQIKENVNLANKENNPSTVTLGNVADVGYEEVKTTMRKRSEIASLGATGGGVFQSTIGIDISSGERLIPSLLFDNSIQDIICFEASKMLGNDFSDLNSFYISDTKIGVFQDVAAGISLDSKNKLTVARVADSGIKTLNQIQDEIGDIFAKFEDGILSGGDLLPSTFTITDLSSTKVSFMLPLLNGNECLIIGVVLKARNRFGLYVTFDHRVSEGLRVAKFLEALQWRIQAHFKSDVSDQNIECYFCAKSLKEEVELGHRGMLKMATVDGDVTACRNCIEGL